MELNLERVRENARKSSSEDLMDRLTAYRAGMEDAAIEIIESELANRGIDQIEIQRHGKTRNGSIMRGEVARRCSFCDRPAVKKGWGWHWVFGLVPTFPRRYLYCEIHWQKRKKSSLS
jgi:hypothetical protein